LEQYTVEYQQPDKGLDDRRWKHGLQSLERFNGPLGVFGESNQYWDD